MIFFIKYFSIFKYPLSYPIPPNLTNLLYFVFGKKKDSERFMSVFNILMLFATIGIGIIGHAEGRKGEEAILTQAIKHKFFLLSGVKCYYQDDRAANSEWTERVCPVFGDNKYCQVKNCHA